MVQSARIVFHTESTMAFALVLVPLPSLAVGVPDGM
jgi:hypothetical protein